MIADLRPYPEHKESGLPWQGGEGLLSDLRSLIQSARQRIAIVACSTQTLLCWHVGRRLLNENLQGGRAAYGKQILVTVSQELTVKFGQAFTLRSLYRAIQFCQCFTDQEIVSTLSTQMSWSHFREQAVRRLDGLLKGGRT